ncbi:hypothetical protein MC7420_172 [Coleofasciculus chthonoplastes PCC 7420]|uniref:Uncharacterized protein n=2 Tax=Coleofasciculus chthonoplastes TaxID=64178 RepID=B4VL07_9CYAN|nr:hypothetical protein MC7420_172 [Coleofasciculus chthonoplastes PCC 7420]
MLEEADELMAMLPFSDRQRLLASLEMLQPHTQAELHQKIQQILGSQMELHAA